VALSNVSTAAHTFTPVHGGFKDSGIVNSGQKATVRMSFAGTYKFMCSIHPYMTGTVRVT
jgi:plastocyanin